jgi:hypothetical protein
MALDFIVFPYPLLANEGNCDAALVYKVRIF